MSGTMNLLNPSSGTGGVPLLQMPPSPMSQMGNLLDVQGKAIQNQQQGLAYQQAQLAPAYSALGAVVAKGSAATNDDITRAFAAAQRAGGNTEGLQAELTARLTGSDNMPKQSPAEIAKTMWMRGQSAENQANLAIAPAPIMQNIGGQIVVGQYGARAGPNAATFTPSGTLPLGPTPQNQQDWALQWNSPTTVMDANNQPVTVPRYRAYGYDSVPAYGTGGGGQVGPVPGPAGTGTPSPSLPGYQAPSQRTAPGPASAATAPPGAPLPTGLGPGGEVAPLTSAKQYGTDLANASSFRDRVQPLESALDILNQPGAPSTGPGSDVVNRLKSWMVARGVPLADTQGVSNFDELKKLLAQRITGMGFAAGSDSRMNEAITGSPNTDISTMANKDIIRYLIGMERFKQAQVMSFNQDHGTGAAAAAPAQYATQSANFSNQYDPRAFIPYGSQAEQSKAFNALPQAEKLRYWRTYKLGKSVPGLMPEAE